MVSLTSVNNALRNTYLDVISDCLDTQIDPVLAKIEKTSSQIYGKEIIALLYSDTMSDTEEPAVAKLELANIFGSFEISDKAIRAVQNSPVSIVSLINEETEELIKSLKHRLSNAFYSEDTPSQYLAPEQIKYYSPILLTGLKHLFSNSATIYGLSRDKYSQLRPQSVKIDSFDVIKIQEVVDNTDQEFNFMICSRKTARLYREYMLGRFQNIETQDLGKCGRYTLFNGLIPIVPANIPDDKIYFINTSDFKLHQLCGWQWIEDDSGSILKQVPDKPKYSATLVKYANVLCHKPYRQLEITFKGV